MHVRRDDMVMVAVGKDRGKTGKVLRVLPGGKRVIVEGLNLHKKHVRANPGKQEQGGILEKEGSITISNVMLYCTKCSQRTRAGHRVLEDGTRVRYCRKCNEAV
jgi:large subunit ribosomal protein L24